MNLEVRQLARALRQKSEGLRRSGVRHYVRGEPKRSVALAAPAGGRGSRRADGETKPSAALAAPAGGRGSRRADGETKPSAAIAAPDSVIDGGGEHRAKELAELAREVAGCTRCAELARCRTQTVFGVGNPAATLCFVGEAPGADEDAQGEPFVGAAGQLLNKIITAMGLNRSDVYICNVLKCRPPNNRTPLPDEVSNCRTFLERQLETLRPKFICALGAVAAKALLDTTQSLGRLRGQFHQYRGIPVLCTYHPAYLLRYPEAKKDVWDDLQILMREMGLKSGSRA